MNEITITAKVLLDNYYKGNKWLSSGAVYNGYEMEQDGKNYVYALPISRRTSDIKVKGVHIEKLNGLDGQYMSYRLAPTISKDALNRLAVYSGYKKKKVLFSKNIWEWFN